MHIKLVLGKLKVSLINMSERTKHFIFMTAMFIS